jgi:hypothetical protein
LLQVYKKGKHMTADPLIEVSAEPNISPEEYAALALAEAMAYQLHPDDTSEPPSPEILHHASEIVRAVLDRAGNRFAVLVCGSEADAQRLATACGKNGEHVGEALRVLERLVEI